MVSKSELNDPGDTEDDLWNERENPLSVHNPLSVMPKSKKTPNSRTVFLVS